MTTKKMLVVTLAKTRAVLAAASRRGSGVPAVEELVGSGLLARTPISEASLTVPAAELEVKEVDYSDDVFRSPHAYVVDSSGTLIVSQNIVSSIAATITATDVSVEVSLTPPAVAADKNVVVVIEAGANVDALKFVGKTVLNGTKAVVAVSGVPPGDHVVLASVDGYNSRLDVGSF